MPLFEPTQPPTHEPLMRVSAFRRWLRSTQQDPGPGTGSALSSLNPSLAQDLQRFEQPDREGPQLEALEVMAAAVRHARRLRLHVRHGPRVLPLVVLPPEGRVESPLPPPELLACDLAGWRVLHVEPAPPAGAVTQPLHGGPLSPLLWALALHGSREALLPEIAGNAAYRVAPGADLTRLQLPAALSAAVRRLRRGNANLREIAGWPEMDAALAKRLLNALYLQAALMVSRTHPAATNESWSGDTPSRGGG
jgi:hypothetical protein